MYSLPWHTSCIGPCESDIRTRPAGAAIPHSRPARAGRCASITTITVVGRWRIWRPTTCTGRRRSAGVKPRRASPRSPRWSIRSRAGGRPGVLDYRQRVLTSWAGRDRSVGREVSERGDGPYPEARLRAEPGRDLLLDYSTQGALAQRFRRPHAVERRVLVFEDRYNATAVAFKWRSTTADLHDTSNDSTEHGKRHAPDELTNPTTKSIPKGTLHRVLSDMAAVRLLDRSGNNYRLGGDLFELGMRASVQRSLLEVAIPFMEDLRAHPRDGAPGGPRRDGGGVPVENRGAPASKRTIENRRPDAGALQRHRKSAVGIRRQHIAGESAVRFAPPPHPAHHRPTRPVAHSARPHRNRGRRLRVRGIGHTVSCAWPHPSAKAKTSSPRSV